ncbi:hypothetical protein B0H15DRAFT_137114 [Mycena belliarum]|uniref:Uncharacterized protein n=1 Tax=Mycena belliarum TaxID=1033014 RepID=A0AAD6UA62_9AGAR|nr:hypothetical protein B0H15DRAFT_137114 [Mycena belliae]
MLPPSRLVPFLVSLCRLLSPAVKRFLPTLRTSFYKCSSNKSAIMGGFVIRSQYLQLPSSDIGVRSNHCDLLCAYRKPSIDSRPSQATLASCRESLPVEAPQVLPRPIGLPAQSHEPSSARLQRPAPRFSDYDLLFCAPRLAPYTYTWIPIQSPSPSNIKQTIRDESQ